MKSDNPSIRHIMALVLDKLDKSDASPWNREMLVSGLEDIQDLEEGYRFLNGFYEQARFFYEKGDMSELLHSRFFKPGHEDCSEGSCFDADNDPCE